MWLGLCGYWKWFMAPREGVGKGVLGIIGRLEVGRFGGKKREGEEREWMGCRYTVIKVKDKLGIK